MKILFITKSLKPNSGWGRYSKEVTDGFGRLDVKVKSIEIENKISPFWFLSKCLKARKEAKECDVVHALDGWPYGFYGYAAVWGTGKKLFVSGIGTYSVPHGNFIKVYMFKMAYIRASKIFAISRYTAQRILNAVPRAQVEVVHMGLTKLPNISEVEKAEFKKRFNLPDCSPFILTVGEIKNRKGQYDTLEAVSILKNKYPHIGYIMVGNSTNKVYRKKIEDLASQIGTSENVKVISDVKTDRELSYFYSQCDVLALNSRNDQSHFEGFGLVLLEAAQFGKPVIGSKNCGIEDSVWDGYNGYLTNQGDSFDISQKIEAVLNKDKAKLAENSMIFLQRFSWDRTIEEYLRHYRQ